MIKTDCDGEMNSAIINYYPTGSSRTRPHSDEESYIDQTASICNFSIGSTRNFGIFNKKEVLLEQHALLDGSLFIMKPCSQGVTKHQVLTGGGTCGERCSISFRKIELREVKNEWPFPNKIKPLIIDDGENDVEDEHVEKTNMKNSGEYTT